MYSSLEGSVELGVELVKGHISGDECKYSMKFGSFRLCWHSSGVKSPGHGGSS